MTMKLLVLLSLAAVVIARPRSGSPDSRLFRPPLLISDAKITPRPPPPEPRLPIPIVRDNRLDQGDGHFKYDFETAHGIQVEATGTPGSKGQSNISGSYRFIFPDGTQAVVTYIADENGYRADSPLLPTPHPLPAHAIEQIRFAEQERGRSLDLRSKPF